MLAPSVCALEKFLMRIDKIGCSVLLVTLLTMARGAEAQAAPPFTAGWQDGFVLQSGDGDYRLALGMVAQADGRFPLDDPPATTNTFTLRKIRPTFTGRMARYFDFKVMPDFGLGMAVVLDAYLDVRFSPAFRVRTGKDKTPVGYELLQGDAFLLFPERALASSLVPNRDIGVQVQGDLAGGRVYYAAGVFNGVPDGANSTTELDANNGKDFAARIVVQPFRTMTTPARPLNGLGFHVGASTGRQSGTVLPLFRTSTGQTYFSYAGSTANGERHRVSPAVFYYYKAFGAFSEHMWSVQEIANERAAEDVGNHAWEVTGSFLVTGEAASDRGVRPREPFDPANGRWGALQVLARVTELVVDRDAFTAGFAAPGASRTARSFAVGANWYPVAWVKYYAAFERTVFDGDAEGPRPAENVIIVRAQLAF
jgi:phosphate-selective porin OprO/OprP